MIWNSVLLMTLIDFLIIFAVLYSVTIFCKHYRAAKQLGLTVSVNFILSGLVLIALFYLVDLSIMYIYPLFTSQAFAMTSMTNLHLNWSWIGILISVGAISISLSYLVQALIPKTFHTLETLELTKDTLNKELVARQHAETAMRESYASLEQRVGERTAELMTANEKLRQEIIERKQAEKALARRVQEMEALYETSLEINSHLEISVLLQAIVRRAAELLETHMGGLFLMQPDGETLKLAVGHNQPEEFIGNSLCLGEGLSGQIAQVNEPLQIANYRQWEGQVSHLGHESIGRILGVPLKQGDQIIGVINVFDEEEGDFDEDEVRLLSLFATQAVIAIEKARLIEQVRLRREHLKILHEIDQAILTAQSPEEIAEATLSRIPQLMPCHRASVVLHNAEVNEATLLAVYLKDDTRLPKEQRFTLTTSKNITQLQQGQPHIVEDIATLGEPSDTDRQLLAEGIRSYINMPLIFRDELIGSLNLEVMNPAPFDQVHVEIAHQIADQLAIAIQQAQLHETETQRRRETETLRNATVAVTSALDLDQVLDAILTHLEAVVPYDSAGVFLQEGDHLRAVAGRGFPVSEDVVGRTYPLEDDVLFPDIQRTGRPLILADAQADPRFVRWAGTNYIRGWIGVPLIVSGEVIGFLTLDNRDVAAYSEAEASLAQALANQAAIAIENARLFDQVQHYTKELEQRVADRTRELSALYDVTAVATESLDLRTALERSLKQVLDAMRTDIGYIRLLDETGQTLHLVAQQGLPPNYLAIVEVVPSNSGLVGQVIASGEPLIVPDVTTDPHAGRAFFLAPQTAYVGVPIRARGRVLGTLSILKEKGQPQFSMEEITLLTSIADHVGVVVESARLRQLASQAAVLEERGRLARGLHDSVTQLLYSLNLFAEVGRESRQIGDLDQVDNTLNEIGTIAQQALKEMRLLVYELRPATLEQEGLIGALQHRLDAVEGRAGVKARLLLDEVFELERHLEEALYHITQEALNNALKHAAATVVTVRLGLDDEQQITLEVTDNGSGFDSHTLNRGGLGLISMQERTEALGGILTIHSTPGEGTMVKVRVKSKENGKSKGTF